MVDVVFGYVGEVGYGREHTFSLYIYIYMYTHNIVTHSFVYFMLVLSHYSHLRFSYVC